MIARKEIEERLKLSILNLCLASVSRQDGAITIAKNGLFDMVEKMIREAETR